MLSQNLLNQIQELLNLEKINIIQSLTLVCFPREQILNLDRKLREIKKKLGPNIEIKIVKEGVINDQSIEFCEQSGSNESG